MTIQENVLLSQHTNLRVGGPADYFVDATAEQELLEALAFAKKKEIPYFVLGGGTNVVIGDGGYRGLVVKNKMNEIKMVGMRGTIRSGESKAEQIIFVQADAGVLVNRLVRYTLDESLTGLENFLGQPGTVGGATWINAHNMNQNDFFGDHVSQARILEGDGEIKTVKQQYFKFGYDQSSLQKTGALVLSVIVRLTKSEKEKVWEKGNAAMHYRSDTQPKGSPTAGCTFRNITLSDAMRIGTPNHTRSAGYLIDAVGLKGKQIGGAKISGEHANFMLNIHNAKAADIMGLIRLAKREVKKKFGVSLKEEVVLVGEF
ncbi:UDP-N-acetylmuramate dehydrogenase [Candidatus Roizmanbacteria bacterium]|nr:UDP-N-acetylmuramate dehydrogenase [Candidatus Roizmanbacteria bacterium]